MNTRQPTPYEYLRRDRVPATQKPAPGVDKQLEIARRYRPDGSLEAERLRIRERAQMVANRGGDGQEAGCLALLFLAGTAYAAGAAGSALIGGWLGVLVGLAVWAGMIWSWT